MYLFQQLKNAAKNQDFKGDTRAAQEWFRNEAQNIGKTSVSKVMDTAGAFKLFPNIDQNDSGLGKLYMFVYDAKWKAKMPFYDAFPLVFPIQFDSGGMLGLNLHYLPPGERAALMDALYTTANNQRFDKRMKLVVTYSQLKMAATQFAGYENCIKRYLFDHVRSPFHYVNPADWDKALMLPLQRFKVNPNSFIANKRPLPY